MGERLNSRRGGRWSGPVAVWCSAIPDRLSPWELSFVEQMRERFDDGRPLTEGQFDKLQEIAEEKET